MRAIDLRYNKEIIGGKRLEHHAYLIERCGGNKTDIIHVLSNNGCPCNMPYKYNGCVNRCGERGCVKCWEQEVKEV